MGVIKGFNEPERARRDLEDELYDSVQREAASLRRARASESQASANNLEAMLQRVAGSSLHDIDRIVDELQILRERLETEGERVQREIAEYAHLSQSSLQSTKIIAESLTQWKKVPDGIE